jgi:hypothetical protein
MISFKPVWDALGRCRELMEVAEHRWEIGPSEHFHVPPARFLPGQLDRIQGTEFGDLEQVLKDFNGGFVSSEPATFGYRLKNVDLVDGVLYSEKGVRHLRRRRNRVPAYVVPNEISAGAIYESWLGNRWFGNWLTDDCPRYQLAAKYGTPVTTLMEPQGHVPDYEARLGMTPKRIDRAHFSELIFFEDFFTKNSERKNRAGRVRDLLATSAPQDRHPGVFLLRGKTGAERFLVNETEIAERLATDKGFQVIDPAKSSVEEIIAACAGAGVVIGVEGSHLAHGLAVMSPGATLFVIQPPTRVTSVLKFVTDRQGMGYAFVVGSGEVNGFTVDMDDINRTLDLVA